MKQPRTKNVNGILERIDGKFIRFDNYNYKTKDPQVIAFLRKLIDGNGMSAKEVFEMPDVDPLTHGNVTGSIESMELHELRAACNDRNIKWTPVDPEDTLRYRLLKKLSGFDGEKEEKPKTGE